MNIALPEPGLPKGESDDIRYALHTWGRTSRYCLIKLAGIMPSALIIWLSIRR